MDFVSTTSWSIIPPMLLQDSTKEGLFVTKMSNVLDLLVGKSISIVVSYTVRWILGAGSVQLGESCMGWSLTFVQRYRIL